MTNQTPSPENAPGLFVPVETLPTALRLTSLEFAADDARNIGELAGLIQECIEGNPGDQATALLWTIRDLADILAWNLNRMDTEQRKSA